jgi:hypothetical protein
MRNGANPVTDTEAALSRLHSERAAALTRLDGLSDMRREALKKDATDKEVLALDAQADSARIVLEKLDIAEPELIDRLQAARGAARAAEWRERHKLYHEAAMAFLMLVSGKMISSSRLR